MSGRTPPDLLAELPRRVADGIATVLPDLRQCAAHEARFTLSEIERGKFPAPAVRVVALDVRPEVELAGSVYGVRVAMAAYAVTENRKGLPRDVAAMAMIQAMWRRTVNARWGLACAGPAERLAAQNLSSSATAKAGIALWALTWSQPLAFDWTEIEDGVVPPALYLGVAPDIGADHEDDYRLVSGGLPGVAT